MGQNPREIFDLRKINSMTKYPSIPTYHGINKDGSLNESTVTFPADKLVIGTEKVDGCNARIIMLPAQGLWIIGSRDELLTARYDLVSNNELGIVDVLRPIADGADFVWSHEFVVFYVEVFGDRRMPAWKQYSDGNFIGVRLFDVLDFTKTWSEVHDWDLERIAAWREQGRQPFVNEHELEATAEKLDVPLTPRLFKGMGEDIPKGIDEMWKFLGKYEKTECSLNDTVGDTEGIVLRTHDRSVIAKARVQNYRRTFQVRDTPKRGDGWVTN